MRLLLDTHALLWWLAGKTELPVGAREAQAQAENLMLVSNESVFDGYGIQRLW